MQLYLNIYNFLQTAYLKPSAKKVNELSGQMMTYSLSNDTDTNKKLLGQLKNVANDYNQLQLIRFCEKTPGLGSAAFNKFKKLLDRYTKTLDLQKIIIGLGLPSLGEKSVKNIFDSYSYEELIDGLKNNTISNIPGINYIALQSLYTNLEYIDKVVNSFQKLPVCELKKDEKVNIIDIRRICITGPLSVSRKQFLDMCSNFGLEESSIAKADVLITNTPNSNTNKNKEAKKRGIPVMSEIEFIKKYLS